MKSLLEVFQTEIPEIKKALRGIIISLDTMDARIHQLIEAEAEADKDLEEQLQRLIGEAEAELKKNPDAEFEAALDYIKQS